MTGTSGLTASDVLAITRDNDGIFGGDGVGFIILLFIFIWAVFGGNGFGNGGNALTQAELQAGLYNQTTDSNLRDIRNAQCVTNQEIMQNRYDNALQTQTLSSQFSDCCCKNQLAISEQTNALMSQMTANTQAILDKMCQQEIQSLRDQLNLAEIASANSVQSQNLLSNLGRWVPYAGSNSCGCNCNY